MQAGMMKLAGMSISRLRYSAHRTGKMKVGNYWRNVQVHVQRWFRAELKRRLDNWIVQTQTETLSNVLPAGKRKCRLWNRREGFVAFPLSSIQTAYSRHFLNPLHEIETIDWNGNVSIKVIPPRCFTARIARYSPLRISTTWIPDQWAPMVAEVCEDRKYNSYLDSPVK